MTASNVQSGPTTTRVSIRHLEYFLAVLDHGKITAAADALFVASSGVSQTIADLERHLSIRLFDRSAQGSVPTEQAKALEPRARSAVRAFYESISGASGAGTREHLSVISSRSFVHAPTAGLVSALLETVPSAQIDLREAVATHYAETYQPVLAGLFDVAITERPEGAVAGARIVDLPDLEIYIVCPPGTPPAKEGVFEVTDLLDIGLIVIPTFETSRLYRDLYAVEPRIDEALAMRCEHRDVFLDLARAGAGAVLMDRDHALQAEQTGCVVGRLHPIRSHKICALTRANHSTPVLERFLKLCGEGRQ